MTLRYPAPCPAIPLRPTAIAAANDMGILLWVLGPSRAVPLNYLSVELNESRLAFAGLGGGTLYRSLVSEAVDEAGGRAFVTELATSVASYAYERYGSHDLQLLNSFEQHEVTRLLGGSMTWTDVIRLMATYGPWDGMVEVVDRYVSFPGGLAFADVVLCPNGCLDGAEYMTRMFTTMDGQ